jgi:type I restriction enzyme S subunit
MREGYKDSPLGEIPINWKTSKLGNVAKTFAGGTPKKGVSEYYNGTIPWIKSGEVNNNSIETSEEFVTELALKETSAKLIEANSILVAMYGATAGKVGVLKVEACSNQAVLAVNSKTETLSNNFLYHYLKKCTTELLNLCQGSGQPNLSKGIVDSVQIPFPPFPEQQKIAEILSTVDAKIEIIDQQITETQELKKGLMQQLLTKGIAHTEFKDSALGKIPKSWEVVGFGYASINLDNLRKPIKSSDRQKKQGIYPYFGAQGIIDYIDDYIFQGIHLLIAEDGENVKSRKNDIAFIANDKFWVNNHAHVILNNNQSDIYYLKYFVNNMDIKPYVTGLAQPKLNKGNLEKLLISLPPLKEQNQIAEILTSVDDKLEVLSEKKITYQEMKQGLMQQLLTGKVRV